MKRNYAIYGKHLGQYTWNEISSLLSVSSKTLQRRAADWGIHKFTGISDRCLNEEVDSIIARFPNSGEVMINGHLRARNVWKIRNSQLLAKFVIQYMHV